MTLHIEGPSRRVPTLVQLCQRVAAANVDSISSFGDDLPFQLVKPILERCDADQLTRFEASSPQFKDETQELWKQLCYSMFSLIIANQLRQLQKEPECWRSFYRVLQSTEAKRLESASNKLRNQRNLEEERKKEREVKITDRVPPPKKPRFAWGATAPKTLFQKTRSEASRMQKSMYTTRMVPPMIGGKTHRVLPTAPDLSIGLASRSIPNSRVTVNTVLQRRPEPKVNASAVARPSQTTTGSVPPDRSHSHTSPISKPPLPLPTREVKAPPQPPSQVRPISSTPKKDRTACLFVPKHRAHSQRA